MFEKLKALCKDEIRDCESNYEKFLLFKDAATNDEDRMIWELKCDDAALRVNFWRERLRQLERL